MDTLRLRKRVFGGDKYIEFVDPLVGQICASNWGDGRGITRKQAEAVTSIGAVFQRTAITSFNELVYFTGVVEIAAYAFYLCSSLVELTFPPRVKILRTNAFAGTKVARINGDWMSKMVGFEQSSVGGLSAFTDDLNFPNLEWVNQAGLYGTGTRKVISLGKITTLSNKALNYSRDLVELWLPSTLTSIGSEATANCGKLDKVVILATTPPMLSNVNAFNQNKATRKFYVPYSADHSILNAYKTAPVWLNFESAFDELNEDGTIPNN